MGILSKLENYLQEFNFDFEIDTLRIDFIKTSKKSKLDSLGRWKRINKPNHYLMLKLKRRYEVEEITTVYQLENHNIYYYNSNRDKPKYRIATMVIFGLKQYHKEPPPKSIVSKIISILKNITNIDLCLDIKQKPNIEILQEYFELKRYITKDGVFTDTYYINKTDIAMIDKITIYNKAFKNRLDGILWRIEATISIPNYNCLALPLHEFKQITDLAKGIK